MVKWHVAAIALLAVALATATGAGATRQAGGVTVLAVDAGQTFAINRSVTDRMYFAPGRITVKSGDTLTFAYKGRPGQEPHTLTILAPGQLPHSAAAISACENGGSKACNAVVAGHIKNPKQPPGPSNDIAHWAVDKGQAGLDEPGDSIAIEGAAHRTISMKVTAPAGTTLHYLCLVHPWMQGTIAVR